jgi:phosphohistidine phosphatase
MPQLHVLRHAKSSWDDPALDDHERPLAPRGRRAVTLLARYVEAHELHPAQVLCSTARRARETLDGVAPGGEVFVERELYDASTTTMLERLKRVPSGTPSVMVIGHNPALQTLVLRLAGDNGSNDDLAMVRRKFPTGALATLSFECDWSELEPGSATLVGLVRPKDLYNP